jgi:hypothetical protein
MSMGCRQKKPAWTSSIKWLPEACGGYSPVTEGFSSRDTLPYCIFSSYAQFAIGRP